MAYNEGVKVKSIRKISINFLCNFRKFAIEKSLILDLYHLKVPEKLSTNSARNNQVCKTWMKKAKFFKK